MKNLSFVKMEQIEGGWSLSQHIGCTLFGLVAGGGIAGVAVYAGCLLTLDNEPFVW